MQALCAPSHVHAAISACSGQARHGEAFNHGSRLRVSVCSSSRRFHRHEHGGGGGINHTSSRSSPTLTAVVVATAAAASAAPTATTAAAAPATAVLPPPLPSRAGPAAAAQERQPASGSSVAQAHASLFRTPLTAPLLQPSHTSVVMPLAATSLYGNYALHGPAVLRVVRDGLLAYVQPGGAVSVLESPSQGPTTMSSATLSHDEGSPALCLLVGRHLELDGAFVLPASEARGGGGGGAAPAAAAALLAATSVDDGGGGGATVAGSTTASMSHDGKTILSVGRLPEGSCITLLPGGSISHPINVHPTRGRPRAA